MAIRDWRSGNRPPQQHTRNDDEAVQDPRAHARGPQEPLTGHGETSRGLPPRYGGSEPGFGSHGMGYFPQSGTQTPTFGAYGITRDTAQDYTSVSRSGSPGDFDQPHGRMPFGWDASFGSDGEVSSFAEHVYPARRDAPRQAGQSSGPRHTGAATASPRRGPKNYQRSDERIQEDICERLTHMQHIDASEVTVEVKGGTATLYGTVPHRQMKHWIEDAVAECSGVKDVENKLRVALTAPLPQDKNRGGF